jgi:ribosomal protein S18 acetylase RimI-like enzyme
VPALILIRPARLNDRKTLGRLGAMLVEEHHQFDPLRFIAPIPDLPERYGELLVTRHETPDNVVLVAERDGAVVGYAFGAKEGFDYMALRGPAGVIYDLLVDPDHRRQGIGAALMDAMLEALKALGAPRALLFTAENNHLAQAMFERAGFRRTMIEMTRELEP